MNEQIVNSAINASDTLTQSVLGALVFIQLILIVAIGYVLYKLYVKSKEEANEHRKELKEILENQTEVSLETKVVIKSAVQTFEGFQEYLKDVIEHERKKSEDCYSKSYSKVLEIEKSTGDSKRELVNISKKLDVLISCDIGNKKV